jgi:hypothetical protein
MKKYLFSTWLIIYTIYGIRSQPIDCYIHLEDIAGFETAPYQDGLELVACELIQAFPSELQNQFKVFDFGFYSITDDMQGGFEAAWERVILKVSNEAPYYLVFGKQSDETGLYSKFWFELKMPENWLGQCFDQSYISMLENYIIFNFNQIGYSKNPNEYAEFEKKCMYYLKSKVESLSSCCQPNLTSDNLCNGCISSNDVNTFFLNNGFDSIRINILNPDITIVDSCLCQSPEVILLNKKNKNSMRKNSFDDFTHGYIIEINGKIINLSEKANKFLDIYEDGYGIVTHSLSFCQNDFNSLLNSFNEPNHSFWFHISDSLLFFKVTGIGDDIKIGTCSAQYREKIQCMIDYLGSTSENLYTEILNYYDNSKKDIIINVDCPPGDNSAAGQTIDDLLGSFGVLEIYINPSEFDKMDTYPFSAVATLIHEACHALISLKVLKAGGANKCNWLNYNYYYTNYNNNKGQADECIIATNFIDKQARILWLYNSKHKEIKHYLSLAWGPYFYDYKGCKSDVGYSQTQISDWYLEMRDSTPRPYRCNIKY